MKRLLSVLMRFVASAFFVLAPALALAQAWPITPPLTKTDAAYFGQNSASGTLSLGSGGLLFRKSIDTTTTPAGAAVMCTSGSCAIINSSIDSPEGIRVGASGVFTIDRSFIKLDYTLSGDHGDGLQAYSPYSVGTIVVTNSTFDGVNAANSTADFFTADYWTGNVILQNVLFNGNQGGYGLRIHGDLSGGFVYVWMKNVCFAGSFNLGRMLFLDYGGGQVVIRQWENVRDCTVSGGTLTLGSALTCSSFSDHCPSAGTELAEPTGVGAN